MDFPIVKWEPDDAHSQPWAPGMIVYFPTLDDVMENGYMIIMPPEEDPGLIEACHVVDGIIYLMMYGDEEEA